MRRELKPEIKQALIDMKFIEKYEKLSNKYSDEKMKEEDMLDNLDIDLVVDMIKSLGYSVSINKKEKFLRVQEVIQEGLIFAIHISFHSGRVEFIWDVERDGEVRLGSPWSVYSKLLIDPKYKIKMPAFRDYDELEALLKESFEMYEEFKAILIKEYLS